MPSNDSLIKLPLNLGLEINKILKDKFNIEPRTNKSGILSFEYTQDELSLIEKLEFINPTQGCLFGIELLPNLKSLRVKSIGNTAYMQDKNIASISDKDSAIISRCKNLQYLEIENQAKLSFVDVSQLKKLNGLYISRNSQLEELSGLEELNDLWTLDCYGNESLTRINELNKAIVQNPELTDITLDVLLFPDAMGYDLQTGEINQETVARMDESNVSWQEILSSGKNIKINNYQMMNMHKVACRALTEYVPQHCDSRTAVMGIELYLAENVKYDNHALKNNHSHTSPISSTVLGPLGGANGAYNAFMYNTCVCEGYTRAMQYLLRLKGIKSHNVDCISGKDTLHMSTDKGDDKHKVYDLPDDGYHSIISIDDINYLYDDPCWNAGRYQRGDKSMPWILLTTEEISRDHTLSFNEKNINNNHLNVPRSTVEYALRKISDYRRDRQSRFSENEVGRATINSTTTMKDQSRTRISRDEQEIQQLNEK